VIRFEKKLLNILDRSKAGGRIGIALAKRCDFLERETGIEPATFSLGS
jgi:hypothetical protein